MNVSLIEQLRKNISEKFHIPPSQQHFPDWVLKSYDEKVNKNFSPVVLSFYQTFRQHYEIFVYAKKTH